MTLSRAERLKRMEEGKGALKDYLESVPVEFPISTMKDVRKPETLAYCIKELSSGTTYGVLRRKLGLGPSMVDRKWRVLRELLVEHVLPDTDEEVLKATLSLNALMVTKLEKFAEKVSKRAEVMQGEESEAHLLNTELMALKALSERYETRMKMYLKMKDTRSKEKLLQGKSIIFQNNYYVPRPGQEELESREAKDVIEAMATMVEE